MPEIQSGMTVADLQRMASLEPLEVRILLGFALNLTRVQLITQSERRITAEEAVQLRDVFSRRLQGEPIAYITGQREFYGLEFSVTLDVLIPRHETELLVELAIERLLPSGRLLDMGTGSGAIAIAVAHERPDAQVTALDASDAALDVAQSNASRLLPQRKNPVSFLNSDWYGALEEGQTFSVIAANPPYIHQDDVHLQKGDLRYEPQGALTDHDDGLQALRTITMSAQKHLESSGWLLMEHGFDQGEAVREMIRAAGFDEVQTWRDLAGIERVTGGRKRSF